jgi:hypothetical protein
MSLGLRWLIKLVTDASDARLHLHQNETLVRMEKAKRMQIPTPPKRRWLRRADLIFDLRPFDLPQDRVIELPQEPAKPEIEGSWTMP